MMKIHKPYILLSALLLTAFTMSALSGCGPKPSAEPAPYANSKNPAAVPPDPSLTKSATAPATSGPPEADAYRQKMGAGAKAPGAR